MKDKIKKKLTKKQIQKAVHQSSKMEGMSLYRAKKDKKAVELVKKYAKAFSI